jgi:rod shape-determining protein MreC
MLSRRRTLTLLVVLCLGHILLISSQVQSRQGPSVLQASAFNVVSTVQGATAGVSGGVGGIWEHYFSLVGKSRENEELKARVLQLEGDLQAERARAERTAALEAALALQQSMPAPTLAARVLAGNPVVRPRGLPITIDRGANDGVAANMAVIAGPGIVGRVIGTPGPRAATVQLLVGPEASAGAVVEKNGNAGIVSGGSADGLLRLELQSRAAPVEVGDRIVTSGQDRIYPAGYLIGHIKEIEGAGDKRTLKVAPAVDFSYIEVVLVVLRPPTTDGAK